MFEAKTTRLLGLIMALGLVLAACGGGTTESADQAQTTTTEDHQDEETDHEEDDEHQDEFVFGEPGDPDQADRTIEVEANDEFRFVPEEITVEAGETITFVITNTGAIPHDFTLGDQATQDAHEEEMAEMVASGEMGDHTDPNAVVLEAGETKELTWKFTEAGTVLIGCHQPGHYAAGMKGSVEVGA